jgi:hypothetical protein
MGKNHPHGIILRSSIGAPTEKCHDFEPSRPLHEDLPPPPEVVHLVYTQPGEPTSDLFKLNLKFDSTGIRTQNLRSATQTT